MAGAAQQAITRQIASALSRGVSGNAPDCLFMRNLHAAAMKKAQCDAMQNGDLHCPAFLQAHS